LGLTPAEAISAATINGAYVLRCAARTGSLEPGTDADIAILNVSDYRDLASHFGANRAPATMKRGEVIYREGNIVAPRSEQTYWNCAGITLRAVPTQGQIAPPLELHLRSGYRLTPDTEPRKQAVFSSLSRNPLTRYQPAIQLIAEPGH
jgi:adenine deaminase